MRSDPDSEVVAVILGIALLVALFLFAVGIFILVGSIYEPGWASLLMRLPPFLAVLIVLTARETAPLLLPRDERPEFVYLPATYAQITALLVQIVAMYTVRQDWWPAILALVLVSQVVLTAGFLRALSRSGR